MDALSTEALSFSCMSIALVVIVVVLLGCLKCLTQKTKKQEEDEVKDDIATTTTSTPCLESNGINRCDQLPQKENRVPMQNVTNQQLQLTYSCSESFNASMTIASSDRELESAPPIYKSASGNQVDLSVLSPQVFHIETEKARKSERPHCLVLHSGKHPPENLNVQSESCGDNMDFTVHQKPPFKPSKHPVAGRPKLTMPSKLPSTSLSPRGQPDGLCVEDRCQSEWEDAVLQTLCSGRQYEQSESLRSLPGSREIFPQGLSSETSSLLGTPDADSGSLPLHWELGAFMASGNNNSKRIASRRGYGDPQVYSDKESSVDDNGRPTLCSSHLLDNGDATSTHGFDDLQGYNDKENGVNSNISNSEDLDNDESNNADSGYLESLSRSLCEKEDIPLRKSAANTSLARSLSNRCQKHPFLPTTQGLGSFPVSRQSSTFLDGGTDFDTPQLPRKILMGMSSLKSSSLKRGSNVHIVGEDEAVDGILGESFRKPGAARIPVTRRVASVMNN